MMRLNKILLTAGLGLAVFVIGCSHTAEKAEKAEKPVKEEPRLYKMSELALLMEKMYKDNEAMKKEIQAGKLPESFPEDFMNIHTAAATDPSEINETFHAMADAYLQAMDGIVRADSSTVTRAYNNMVQTCVSCHQLYCQGPIPRIEKLRIPE